MYTRRSWIILYLGGKLVQRCARALRRRLPASQLSFLGIRPVSGGRFQVHGLPFSGRPWKETAPLTGGLPFLVSSKTTRAHISRGDS